MAAHIGTIGAIDAGSNAIRVVVAQVLPVGLVRIEADRVPVRLGRGAFTHGMIPSATIDATVAAFRQFRQLFDGHGVTMYRAVATSAVRDAGNRDEMLHRLYHEAGIELEVIDGLEEARLVRKAVLSALGDAAAPRCILDIGGGSLEVSTKHAGTWRGVSLPIGTVRMLETFGITDSVSDTEAAMVRRYVATLAQTIHSGEALGTAAITGGNADTLAKLLGSDGATSLPTFELTTLERRLPELLHSTVEQRMTVFGLRRDRAEVLAVAALAIATLGRQLGIAQFLAPGVGIREAVLVELAEAVRELKQRANTVLDKSLVTAARGFARRVGHDMPHGEHVCRLAKTLFAQLRDIHQVPAEYGVLLELAALLHDVGEVINVRGHHKHSEYMIRHSRIPGLSDEQRELVAIVVRCHRKSVAECRRVISDSGLSKERRAIARRLTALLRLADGLDTEHKHRVDQVFVTRAGDTVCLDLQTLDGHIHDDELLLRKADFFREEFACKLRMTVSQAISLPGEPPLMRRG